MIDAFSTPRNRIRTFILLMICGLLTIGAAAVGIDDNPPGILFAYLAATAFVLAFVHPWKTSQQFRRLLYASALGFVIFGLLHVVFEVTASNLGDSSFVYDLFNVIGAILFLIATLICPPSLLVGAIGAVAMAIKNRPRPTPGSKTAA